MARRRATAENRIDLIRVMDLLQVHITSALCRAVFRRVRITERQRVWTLDALVRFWTERGVMEVLGVTQMFSSYTKIADMLQLESDMRDIALVDWSPAPGGEPREPGRLAE